MAALKVSNTVTVRFQNDWENDFPAWISLLGQALFSTKLPFAVCLMDESNGYEVRFSGQA